MLTIPIFHCVFNGDASVTHFMHKDIEDMASTLPNIYAVLICKRNNGGVKTIKGGLIVRTMLSHNDDETFTSAIHGACLMSKALAPLLEDTNITFLPAKINIDGINTLTEYECLEILKQQYFKHSQTLVM